jgi:prepilin signal peptidase PulO-like enzyme (type II secretory pathway)
VSHLLALLLFSALVSLVFALLQREGKRDRIRFGLMTFAAFVASALVVGWLMYPFPS